MMLNYDKLMKVWKNHSDVMQLVFLESVLTAEHEFVYRKNIYEFEEEFRGLGLSGKRLEQVIKCIVHFLPYKIIVRSGVGQEFAEYTQECITRYVFYEDGLPSAAEMNEIRRFMEDAGCRAGEWKPYDMVAECLAYSGLRADIIYQIRRVFKPDFGGHVVGEDLMRLVVLFQEYAVDDWAVAAAVLRVYGKSGVDAACAILKSACDASGLPLAGKSVYNLFVGV